MLVGTHWVLGHELANSFWRNIAYSGGCHILFSICYFYQFTCLCTDCYDLSALLGCLFSVFIKRIIYKCLNVCLLNYTAFWLVRRTTYRTSTYLSVLLILVHTFSGIVQASLVACFDTFDTIFRTINSIFSTSFKVLHNVLGTITLNIRYVYVYHYTYLVHPKHH